MGMNTVNCRKMCSWIKKKTNPNQGTLQITYTLQKYQCSKTQRLKNSSKF